MYENKFLYEHYIHSLYTTWAIFSLLSPTLLIDAQQVLMILDQCLRARNSAEAEMKYPARVKT